MTHTFILANLPRRIRGIFFSILVVLNQLYHLQKLAAQRRAGIHCCICIVIVAPERRAYDERGVPGCTGARVQAGIV